MKDLPALKQFALTHFADIISEVALVDIAEMRIFLIDSSFLDVWFSPRNPSKYSYHWERQHIDGTIYRHDNAPHVRWQYVSTFPKHFHNGTESNVIESQISAVPTEALYAMLTFVRGSLDSFNRG